MWPELINALSLWQWLILAAVPPAILALYFLKLKRQPLEVPSTFLWHRSIEDLHVNTIWQRLRNNLLLYLQLLLIGLVMLAVLQPGWRSQKLRGSRFIFLIDNSASMQATDVEPSRLEEAKRQALDSIDLMQAGDVGMVISFNDTAEVKQSFTENPRDLRRAVEAIQPTDRGTSLREAFKVASVLANPGRSATKESDVQVAEPLPATLVIFSDGRFEDIAGIALGNLDPIYRPIGTAEASNVGIVALSVRRHETKPAELQAFGRIQNFGAQPANVGIEILLDEHQSDYRKLTIAPGECRGMEFNLGAIESGVLHLKATTGDVLHLDDEAWIAVNKPRRAKVLLVTSGNEHVERNLATAPALEIADVNVEAPAFLNGEKYRQQATTGGYDLVIYDRCVPKEMPQANTFFIGALPPGETWKAGAKTGQPQIIDTDPAHPIMQWVSIGPDVFVADATPLAPPPGGRTLIDSNRGPLLSIAPREGFEDAVLGFVFVDEAAAKDGTARKYIGTNWMIRASFPVFVLNMLGYLGGGRAAATNETLQPGQSIPLDNPVPNKPLTVRTPKGTEHRLSEGKLGKYVFSDTASVGIYEVRSGGEAFQHFAVNLFQAAESDLAARPEIKIGRVPVQGESAPESSRREIWKLLLGAGLAILLLEWYIYNRRVSL